jgi:hypothetical protein
MSPARRKKPLYDEIRIESWKDFVEIVLSPRYLNWGFRGHSDANWSLQTTLARRFWNAGITDPEAWYEQESRILRIFKRKAHLFLDHIPDDNDAFHWLALMQHHGAPTRLLDFTWSPYVAAFFALESATGDAAIWAISPPELNRGFALTIDGERRLEASDARLHMPGNYEEYYLKNEHSFVVMGEPRVMNQRLIAQSGTFVTPSTLAKPVEDILSLYPKPRETLVKFILARGMREAVMLELYTMNVSYYSLSPGLDGLARSMGYEAEYSWWYNPRTMEKLPGY